MSPRQPLWWLLAIVNTLIALAIMPILILLTERGES